MNHVPLEIHRASVAPDWIDYNGHMNEGYYAVAFGDASDAYLSRTGFNSEYRENFGGTFYTVETHIRYLRELELGDPLTFETTVLGVDARKLHLFHSMVHAGEGFEAATQEAFLLHVATDSPKVIPMRDDLLVAMERDRDAHAGHVPEGVGRSIGPIESGR